MTITTTTTAVGVVLVLQLGSPSFYERERATIALTKMLPMSLPFLRTAETSYDLETSIRARTIVQAYYVETAPAKAAKTLPTDYPLLPWVDRLPEDYPNRRQVIDHYLSVAQHQIGRKGPPLWEDYRLGTRLLLRELFSQRWSDAEVRALLNHMRDGEIDWIRKNGQRYNPPLKLPEKWR